MSNVKGISEVYRLLKENEQKVFEVLLFIGEGEPSSIYQGKPTAIFSDYIDEEIGNVLTIHFDDDSLEVTEQYFTFESGVSTVNDVPYAPYIAITNKGDKDVYIHIEFK